MKTLPSFREIVERFPALEQVAAFRRRTIPFVQQVSATECGAACLAMVLGYYGKTVSVDRLRAAAVSARDATNAHTLISTARLHGLRGRAVSLDLHELRYLPRAAILHWSFTHFVIFERLGRNRVHLIDPVHGRRQVSIAEFSRAFTGVAIVFEPDEHFQPGRTRDRRTTTYFRQILSEPALLLHILLSSLMLQILGLAMPLVTRLLIDRVIPHHDLELLLMLGVGGGALLLFVVWTSILRSILLLYLRTRLGSRLSLAFLAHLVSLPLDFFQRRSTGDLMVRMNSNTTVRELATGTVLATVLDGTLAVSYLLLLLALSLPLAGLTLGLACLQIGLVIFTRRRQRQLLADTLEVQGRSQGQLMEMLAGIELLKAMGAEDRAIQRWSGTYAEELNVALKRGRLEAVLDAANSMLRMGSSVLLLGVGALQVLADQLSVGDMVALTALATGFLTPLLSLALTGSQIQQMGVYLERLNDVLETLPECDAHQTRGTARLQGRITVEHVSFKYGPVSPLVIKDVSMEIREGEFVAIVGRSGSGKSTLARLLAGLYVPTEGRVAYDGMDLRHLDITSVRRQIGVVTQRPQLFGGSIRSNIAFADPDAPFEEVVRVARYAQIHDEIMAMPMGYNTVLVDGGNSLSGGQQQRLTLARALLGQPRIILLDEATSALDAATERAIQEQLRHLACTRVVIAHRLSTIARANTIFVVEDGRIAEQGTHDELLTNSAHYGRLLAAQLPHAEVLGLS